MPTGELQTLGCPPGRTPPRSRDREPFQTVSPPVLRPSRAVPGTCVTRDVWLCPCALPGGTHGVPPLWAPWGGHGRPHVATAQLGAMPDRVLRVGVQPAEGGTRIEVVGELDVATALE